MDNINQYTELVIRYFEGDLSLEEKQQFEADLKVNEALREEYQNQEKMNTLLNDESFHSFYDTMNEVEEDIEKKRKKRIYMWYGAAASVVILLSLSFIISVLRKTPTGEALYAEHYKMASSIIANRSVPEDLLPLEEALRAYDNKEFEIASETFESYLKEDQNNVTAKFYLALSYIELNRVKAATANLKGFLQLDTNVYSDQAEWYLALCYLKQEKIAEAQKILKDISIKSHYKKDSAKAILKALE